MEVKRGYKLTEGGVIPEDWDVQELCQLSSRIMVGIASGATHAYRDTGVVMFRNQNIRPNRLDDTDLLYIDPEYEVRFKNKRLKAGDILTARTGYPGTSAMVPAMYEGCQSFTTLITRPVVGEIVPQFLCVYINSEKGKAYFNFAQAGGSQQNVNAGSLKHLPVCLPPKTEQQKITEALSDADALIDSLEELLVKNRQIKQGTMQELLTGKKRLPGFKSKWKSMRIVDFTDCTAGGTPSTTVPTYWGGEIPWMNSGELNLRKVDDVEGRITQVGFRSSSTKMIPPGCVLVGLAGQGKTRGTVAMNSICLCTNQSIAAIFPNATFNAHYLYYNLDSRYDELRELSAGDGGRGGLNLTLIRSLVVPFPEIDEQNAIAAVLSAADEVVETVQQRLSKARQIKEAMMQELLTGRIRLV